MSTLTPPVQLACPENRHRIEYVLNLVGRKDFDFPSVSSSACQRAITAHASLEQEVPKRPQNCLHPLLEKNIHFNSMLWKK